MILPIFRFNDTPLPVTMPFNKVGVSVVAPLVKFYIPKRIYNGNYYDTDVQLFSVALSLLHNASGNTLNIQDSIYVSKDSADITAAPTAFMMLLYTSSTELAVYRNVANAWVMVSTTTATVTSILEERLLPICLTTPSSLAHELVIDCRESNNIQDGQIVRTSEYTYTVPLVGYAGTQVATLDTFSISLLDRDAIDRVFVTNSIDMDMFPYSAQGKYMAIHVYPLGGSPHATVYFGPNYTQTSAAIPLTNVYSPSGPLVTEGTIATPLTHSLTVTGGVSESSQYEMITTPYHLSRSSGLIDLTFSVDVTVPDGHPYVVIAVHEETVAGHLEYPGLPAHPEAINLVLDFANSEMRLTMVDDTPVNLCSSGCTYANLELTGTWRLVILPTETGSIVSVYHEGAHVDSVTLSVFTVAKVRKPLYVTSYLNSAVSATALITFTQVNNPVPVLTDKDMCSTLNLVGVLTPCMDDATLITVIGVEDHIDFESMPVAPLAQLAPVTSIPGGFNWTVSNNTSPCQIADNALLVNSTKELYLTANSFLLGVAPSSATLVDSFSARWYIRFGSIIAGKIFEVKYTPVSMASPTISITIEVLPTGAWNGWRVRSNIVPQPGGALQYSVLANTAPAPVANAMYCVGITISQSEVILYINGVGYPCSLPAIITRLFNPDPLPKERFNISVTSPVNCFIDSYISAFGDVWTGAEMFALNNDVSTRASTVDCDYTQLSTDISKLPIVSPVTVTGYGGVIVSTQVKSVVVSSTNIVQVYGLPDNYGAGLVDVCITPMEPVQVEVLYGNTAVNLYEALDISSTVIVRAMRISRGMGIFIKTTGQVTVRLTALLM